MVVSEAVVVSEIVVDSNVVDSCVIWSFVTVCSVVVAEGSCVVMVDVVTRVLTAALGVASDGVCVVDETVV